MVHVAHHNSALTLPMHLVYKLMHLASSPIIHRGSNALSLLALLGLLYRPPRATLIVQDRFPLLILIVVPSPRGEFDAYFDE